MKTAIRTLTLAVVLVALSMPAAGSNLAMGADGEVIQLVSGLYGDLFPNGTEAARNANVLALEYFGTDNFRRSLVPSTRDLAVERSPTLYHDPTVDVTYVLWTSRHNGVHPYLRLAQFGDGEWSETLDITGSVFAVKHQPRLSVHHESWLLEDETRVERTVFHVVWWEELGGLVEKRSTTLISENGLLIGSTGILTPGDFVTEESGTLTGSGPLDTSIRLLASPDGVVMGFFSGGSGNIEVLASEVLPVALSRLGLTVEQAILGFDPSAGLTLQQRVVETIWEFGDEFHPATLSAMSQAVLELIDVELAASGGVLTGILNELADKASGFMVEIGAKMKPGGLESQEVAVLTVRPESELATLAAHHLAISRLASFSAPEELPNVGVDLFISGRGTAALLAWDDGDYVAYRETTVDGWTHVSRIDVTKGIDRETAYEILEQRTLER